MLVLAWDRWTAVFKLCSLSFECVYSPRIVLRLLHLSKSGHFCRIILFVLPEEVNNCIFPLWPHSFSISSSPKSMLTSCLSFRVCGGLDSWIPSSVEPQSMTYHSILFPYSFCIFYQICQFQVNQDA